MKLAILANSHLALPTLHDLLQQGIVAGVGVPATGEEAPERVAGLSAAAGVPVGRFTQAALAAELTAWLAAVQPTAVLVMTFPWRIPTTALALLPNGWFNTHFAPLPAYRGPEPLFWLIRNGATAGGVTIHRMTAALDKGPVVLQQAVPLSPTDTHGLHQGHLAGAAVGLVRRLTEALQGSSPLPEHPQDEAMAHYWPRPALPDLCIKWTNSATAIGRLVRAANPWNRGAFATLRGQPIRVLAATPLPASSKPVFPPITPGTVVSADPTTGLAVACGDGLHLRLDIVSLEEGYFTGAQLVGLGIGKGEKFGAVG
jgi:methionyl-tRNA formyltransferase